MRALGMVLAAGMIAAACGGKIDGDGDSGTTLDASSDSSPICKPNATPCKSASECCANACTNGSCGTVAPKCQPDGTPCTQATQCCSQTCSGNFCGVPLPPPCKPDGVACGSAGECCSKTCSGTCGAPSVDASVGCATTSNKQCDQCAASSCCSQEIACENDATCNAWLACIQKCEQQGSSAFACTSGICTPPQTQTEGALFQCAQKACFTPCQTD